jgi:ribosomal protein L35
VAAGSARRQKIESRGKLKMSPKFQQFGGTFKTTREDRKLRPKIQIVSRTLGVPPEIRNRSRTIEKFREKINLSLKICNVRGKSKSPPGGRTSPAKT